MRAETPVNHGHNQAREGQQVEQPGLVETRIRRLLKQPEEQCDCAARDDRQRRDEHSPAREVTRGIELCV